METGLRIVNIDVSLIDPNPMQPRSVMNPETLEDLRRSIEEVGVLSPVIVQKINNRYQLIAGERRLAASKLAGKETIPAIIRDVNSEELLKLALIENIQRENLNDIELALAFKKLKDEFFLTQNEIAKKVGMSRSVVANTLRLLELSQNIQEAVRTGDISAGHARALLSLDENKRERVLEIIRRKSLSVRDVEAMAKRDPKTSNGSGEIASEPSTAIEPGISVTLDPDILSLLKTIEEKLRTKVEISPARRGSEGGKVVIHYFGDEDFKHILEFLAGLKTRSNEPLRENQDPSIG
jgi:ParB family chromosome partitioning protein